MAPLKHPALVWVKDPLHDLPCLKRHGSIEAQLVDVSEAYLSTAYHV